MMNVPFPPDAAIAYRHRGDEDRADADRRKALRLDPSLARE